MWSQWSFPKEPWDTPPEILSRTSQEQRQRGRKSFCTSQPGAAAESSHSTPFPHNSLCCGAGLLTLVLLVCLCMVVVGQPQHQEAAHYISPQVPWLEVPYTRRLGRTTRTAPVPQWVSHVNISCARSSGLVRVMSFEARRRKERVVYKGQSVWSPLLQLMWSYTL